MKEKTSITPGRAPERSLKIAKELSDLVVYCQPVTFDWDNSTSTFSYCYFNKIAGFCKRIVCLRVHSILGG